MEAVKLIAVVYRTSLNRMIQDEYVWLQKEKSWSTNVRCTILNQLSVEKRAELCILVLPVID